MHPRDHHYLIAHRLIPGIFYDDPLSFLGAAHEGKDDFAKHLWVKGGEDFIEDAAERIPPDGISVQPFRRGLTIGAVFKLPAAVNMVEAHMVCALGKIHKGLFGKMKIRKPTYFTLELGEGDHQEPRTVLCTWDAKGGHHNFGDGPENDVAVFIDTCISRL